MRHGAVGALAAAAVLWIGAARGSGDAGAVPAHLAVRAIAPAHVQRGETTAVVVRFEVADGFHVQANPAASEFLIPLQLATEPAEGVACDSVAYPPARTYRLEGADEDLLTYEGTDSLVARVVAAPDAAPGVRHVKAALRYQACDARRCYFPATVGFVLEVVVEE